MRLAETPGNADTLTAMSVVAEKIAELMALPIKDRAFIARELIASLDDTVDEDAETEWNEVIDRRTKEMAEGKIDARPQKEVIKEIRAKLDAARRKAFEETSSTQAQ
jgi:putative addiction module component (TIGR02574 family)